MSIKLEHVSYTYMPGTPYEKEALKDVSLEIKKGEFVAIIGHTGSGKSTLVQNLNGLLHPSKGIASLDGINLADKTKEAKAARSRIGMVFQYPEHQLFAETVYEDIAFGPKNLGLDHDAIDVRVQEGITIIMVTHSMEDAAQFAKRMLVIYQGKVIIDGKPGEVFLKEKDRLLEAGMDIPEVYKLADALRARGMRLPSEITDAKTLLAEIKKRKGLK